MQILGRIKKGLARLGIHVQRVNKTIESRRKRLFHELNIGSVADIGANVGQYAKALRADGFRGRIFSFEPNPGLHSILQDALPGDSLFQCFGCALGATEGTLSLYVSDQHAASSLRKPSELLKGAFPGSETKNDATVPVRTFDSWYAEHQVQCENLFVKLDVQGFESEVLQGAERSLENVRALEMEISLVELYEGQVPMTKLLSEVIDRGFTPIWTEANAIDPRTGNMLQLDFLFAKK